LQVVIVFRIIIAFPFDKESFFGRISPRCEKRVGGVRFATDSCIPCGMRIVPRVSCRVTLFGNEPVGQDTPSASQPPLLKEGNIRNWGKPCPTLSITFTITLIQRGQSGMGRSCPSPTYGGPQKNIDIRSSVSFLIPNF